MHSAGWRVRRGERERERYRKEENKGGMMKFRGVKRASDTHTQPGEQNRALIVSEEANLTLVSEVMSSSAKQQRFFITLLHSLCASVCVFVCPSNFSHSFTVHLYHCFLFSNFTKFTDATVISLDNSWRA